MKLALHKIMLFVDIILIDESWINSLKDQCIMKSTLSNWDIMTWWCCQSLHKLNLFHNSGFQDKYMKRAAGMVSFQLVGLIKLTALCTRGYVDVDFGRHDKV